MVNPGMIERWTDRQLIESYNPYVMLNNVPPQGSLLIIWLLNNFRNDYLNRKKYQTHQWFAVNPYNLLLYIVRMLSKLKYADFFQE